MKILNSAVLAAACVVGVAATAAAQGTQPTPKQPKTDIPAALAKQAKIPLDSARVIASAKFPNATIDSQELEREHGRLIYSFDMKTAGKSGIDEVNVNAMNGVVVGTGHEGPKTEAREAKQEKKTPAKP